MDKLLIQTVLRIFLAGLAMILAGTGYVCADEVEQEHADYMKYVQWGDEAVGRKNWEEAIAYYREAMHLEPSSQQNVMLLSNVGMIQHYMGEDSLALHTLSEARAIAPASVVILRNRARVLAAMGRAADALNDYDMLASMDSTYADTYYDRAALKLREGRLKEAEADATRFLELEPSDLGGKLLMAVILSGSGRPADAVPLYSALIKERPEAVYYAARAMCYLAMDYLQEASDDIARGLELDPDDGELYYCRACLNKLRFREDDARADAARAVSLGVAPQRVAALFGRK